MMTKYLPTSEFLRSAMLFEFHRKTSAEETTKILTNLYGNVITLQECRLWFKKFRTKNYNLTVEPDIFKPIDDDILKTLIEENPRLTAVELAERLETSYSIIQSRTKHLEFEWKRNMWIPTSIDEEVIGWRSGTCGILQCKEEKEPFLDNTITFGKKWLLYTEESEGSTCERRTRQKRSKNAIKKKALLYLWWDSNGPVHLELLNSDKITSEKVTCDHLERLKVSLSQKRPKLLKSNKVLLQVGHNISLDAIKKIYNMHWSSVGDIGYSDVCSTTIHIFKSLQEHIDKKTFQNLEHIESELIQYFTSKPSDFYKEGVRVQLQRWNMVIENEGEFVA